MRPLLDACAAVGGPFVQTHAIFPVQGTDTCFPPDPADDPAEYAGVQEGELDNQFPTRCFVPPHRFDIHRHVVAARQQIGGDVLRLNRAFRILLPVDEADATRLHHAEKKLLLVDAVFAPDQRIEQRACKTTVGIAYLAIALLALKDGINRLQRHS